MGAGRDDLRPLKGAEQKRVGNGRLSAPGVNAWASEKVLISKRSRATEKALLPTGASEKTRQSTCHSVGNKTAISPRRRHAAFTLIEIMVALALSLIILAAVITMFGKVTEGVSESRSLLEMAERLRLTAQRLQLDLAGVTVTMNPPRNPANNEGYFEYIEGSTSISSLAWNTNASVADTTVGQVGDILMFTTRSSGQPFVGKDPLAPGGVGRFYVAEVAWFIRGHTLHRRVLLVLPDTTDLSAAPRAGFYATYDVSARWNGTKMVANTLADLTQRENRFAHNTTCPPVGPSPCDWGQLGLPTLAECSATGWTVGAAKTSPTAKTKIDFWSSGTSTSNSDSYPWAETYFGTGNRLSDDIILTNVIGFDVKVWDPKANSGHGAYVDLGYDTTLGTNATNFSSLGDKKSSLMPQDPNASSKARVYDTYSTSYFDPQGSNGIDDDPKNGVVDDDGEKSPGTSKLLPPYWHPLRGIQVKIRVFEPDSKQIREVTVVQDFLPQ
jgi:prepilin-type N-terminal cleavage/methylation domain-containing protein